jgi:hypothetical protein
LMASMAKVKQPLMFSVACTFLVNLPINLAGAAVAGGFISFGATMLYVGVGIGGGIFLALMDYHDRIMGARSLALDVRTGLNLLNSLLLPLLAFLVSNLRNVLALFLP